MKIFLPKFFPLFGISAVVALALTIGFSCYKLDKIEKEWRRNIEHLSRQDSPFLQTETSLSKTLAAMLISTNLVHRPCSCGFCRPSKGIVVPEHVSLPTLKQLGFSGSLTRLMPPPPRIFVYRPTTLHRQTKFSFLQLLCSMRRCSRGLSPPCTSRMSIRGLSGLALG